MPAGQPAGRRRYRTQLANFKVYDSPGEDFLSSRRILRHDRTAWEWGRHGSSRGAFGRRGCGHASYFHSGTLYGLDGAAQLLSHEAWHDEGLGLRRCRDQQADFGGGDATGVRGRSLSHDLAVGGIRRLHLCDGAYIQTAAPDIDVGGAFGLADDIGNSDALRAETLGDADLPALTHLASGGRELGEDLSFWDRGAVVLTFYIQFQSFLLSDHTGCSRALAHQIGDGDFVAVDGQSHGGERGDQRHHQQDQRQQDQSEERLH